MDQKEVKNQPGKEVKKIFLLNLLNDIKQGLNPSQIAIKKNISKQKLNYYIRRLKNKELIQKIGYGVWIVTKEVKKSTWVAIEKEVKIKEVRGHAFLWKIKLPKIRNWNKRIKILEIRGITYKLVGAGIKIPRIIFKNRKIWLGKKHLIIYEPESFKAENSIESRKLAVYKLLKILNALEDKLKISFKIKGNYEFKVARQHYSLIKNSLAIQYDKEGKKIQIYDKDGLWFVIDNSYNLKECEQLHPKTALIDNLGIQKYFNSHKKTGFKITPEFILNGFSKVNNNMQGIINNQTIFDKNMQSHIKAIQELGLGVEKLNELLDKKKNEEEDLL